MPASVNHNKTQFLLISPKRRTENIDSLELCIKNSNDIHIITQSSFVKYLGFLIDNNLSWKQEIQARIQE